MKKYISLFVALTCITFLLTACGVKSTAVPGGNIGAHSAGSSAEVKGTEQTMEDERPMVMVGGELYYATGHESDIKGGRCGVMDGEIVSTVKSTEIPTQDNQSNFGSGYGYQFVGENSIDIVIDQKWMKFERETGEKGEDPWGIQLTADKISATGLTLVCKQSGGQPSGELQTGSCYWLEVETEGQWVPVEFLPQKYDVAWTSEAWIIAKNDSTKWKVDWAWLYGELPAGKYRIGKEVMDFRATGDYDTKAYYAVFEIAN